ncbi:MAG TPA: SIS domain-containing protein [Methanocorpusculum sp.]|nr:SIS domain-containing protein [Methanocorpusculum sp.]
MDFKGYSDTLCRLLSSVVITDNSGALIDADDAFSLIIERFEKVRCERKKVMIVGNGGSAAIASHLYNDLSKACRIRSMVFTETSLLTALSNDISYVKAYSESVNLYGDKYDVLAAVSSSGKSQNILDSVYAARMSGCDFVLTLSGFGWDNPLRRMGDVNIYVNSDEYGFVELAHSVITHYISDELKI